MKNIKRDRPIFKIKAQFSKGTYKALKSVKVRLLSELETVTESELKRIPYMPDYGLVEIKIQMARFGFSLAEEEKGLGIEQRLERVVSELEKIESLLWLDYRSKKARAL